MAAIRGNGSADECGMLTVSYINVDNRATIEEVCQTSTCSQTVSIDGLCLGSMA
ncbi:hypothetical protein GCM10009425_19320 [Pseudomonas asuensis]|uniref:Uncharacterized protein n=1 Tax=Pseudomonas asuensis TaxID=1825787 RepID=A0ABQ2GRH8_9PSED|nr:hypothetical protein GCM10009425_19320 [Pseudomonas asuensis]